MKISAAINSKSLGRKISRNILPANLIISFLSIFTGIIFGALIYYINPEYFSDGLAKHFLTFSTEFAGKKFYEIFFCLLTSFLLYYFLSVIFGTSFLGAVPVTIATFIKSVGLGCLAAYILSSFEIHGFEYFLLIVLPGKSIMIFSMLLLTENGITSALKVKKLSEKKSSESFDMKLYLKKSAFILIIMILAELIETSCIKLFGSLFDLF